MVRAWVRRALLSLIELYQRTAFLRTPSCRFYPSCSCYAHQAVTRYGTLQGLWLSLQRLLRCHPLHPGGLDPVPLQSLKTR
ncbi:MAG: membrane protein insertion efficiency factor YidD [Candidatus Melainabacteria bacterium]|nr:membrane protein insertion efficiency factor YidD [Candidatus Melainabacteria bacterium]